MNIETSKVNSTKKEQKQQVNSVNVNNSSVKFTDELVVLQPENQNVENVDSKEKVVDTKVPETTITNETTLPADVIKSPVLQPVIKPKKSKVELNNLSKNDSNKNNDVPEMGLAELVKEELMQTQKVVMKDLNIFDKESLDSNVVKKENEVIKAPKLNKLRNNENIFAQKVNQGTLLNEPEQNVLAEGIPNDNVEIPVENVVNGLSNIVKELNQKTQQVVNNKIETTKDIEQELPQTMEEPIENVVEQLVQIPVEEVVPESVKPIQKPIEEVVPEIVKPIQKPIEEVITESVKPIQKPIEEVITESVKPIQKPIEEVVTESVKPIQKPVEEVVTEPVKPIQKPVEEVVPESVKPIQKPVEEVAPESVKPIQKPIEEVVVEPVKPIKNPVEEVVPEIVKPIQKPIEEVITEPVKPIQKPVEEVVPESVKPIQKPIENIIKEPTESIQKPSEDVVLEVVKPIQELKDVLNQSEEIVIKPIKKPIPVVDKKEEEGEELINNDINIQESKDILPQMSTNMNFNSDGQPFSSFMGEENKESKSQSILGNKAQDLAEEAAILSTMAENVAIANKNNVAKKSTEKKVQEPRKSSPLTQVFDETVEPEIKTVTRNEGIKKVDTKTGVTVETVVKFDNVIMNEADVEVFVQLVENGQVDMKNLAPEAAQKSVQVSKTLADMLAKSMDSQQPVRIDFDNDISVIIRISRDGKVSAEFLPSSQVAEAYLKENLPLLRQKFDDNNIKYDDLSQRNQRDNREKENNRKKGRNDE